MYRSRALYPNLRTPFGVMLWLSAVLPLAAQSLQVLSATAAPGESVSLDIVLTAPADKAPVTVQFESSFPAQLLDMEGTGPTLGKAGLDAGKSIVCNPKRTYVFSCSVVGGDKPIANGTIAVFRFKVRGEAWTGTSAVRIEKADALTADARGFELAAAHGSLAVIRGGAATPVAANVRPADPVPAPNADTQSARVVLERYQAVIDNLLNVAKLNLDFAEARAAIAKIQKELSLEAQGVQPPPSPAPAPGPAAPAQPGYQDPPASDSAAAAAHNEKGRELLYRHRYRDAVGELTQSLNADPHSATARNARGFAYFMMRDLVNAKKDLDEVIRQYPDYQNAYANRAAVRKAMGDRAGSAQDLARAKALKKP